MTPLGALRAYFFGFFALFDLGKVDRGPRSALVSTHCPEPRKPRRVDLFSRVINVKVLELAGLLHAIHLAKGSILLLRGTHVHVSVRYRPGISEFCVVHNCSSKVRRFLWELADGRRVPKSPLASSTMGITQAVGMPFAESMGFPLDSVPLECRGLENRVDPVVEVATAVSGPQNIRDTLEFVSAFVSELRELGEEFYLLRF